MSAIIAINDSSLVVRNSNGKHIIFIDLDRDG